MKALLLLAGRSTRFWPLSEKTLFPIAGKSLLEHQVKRLQDIGCSEILLVVGDHNRKEAEEIFPDFEIIEQEDLSLGTMGALLSALPYCGQERVLVVSGNDVVEEEAYRHVLDLADGADTDGVLLAKRMDRYFPGGYITTKENRVVSIVEKPGEGKEPSDLVNIVVHVHNDASVLLKALKRIESAGDDGYEQALQELFREYTYVAARYEGVWQATKYPWHFLPLLPILLKDIDAPTIHPTAKIHPTAIVEGHVVIGENASVFPYACLRGPCYIGDGSTIGNNALVRGSSIGEHCVIGYGTEVKDSILHSHVWTHSSYIGDSVVGKNVSFGAGSVTGNLRLDEEEILSMHGDSKISTGLTKFGAVIGSDCRIGIHVGINPGIKIGKGSFVSSQSLVSRDIPENSFAIIKNGELSIRENTTVTKQASERDHFKKKIS